MTDNPAKEYMLDQIRDWPHDMCHHFDSLCGQGKTIAEAYAATLDEFGMARNPEPAKALSDDEWYQSKRLISRITSNPGARSWWEQNKL